MKKSTKAFRFLARLDALNGGERFEDLSLRFGLPFIPEFELSFFRKLHDRELRTLLEALENDSAALREPLGLALRGRLRRLLGDDAGAFSDLNAALDRDASLALAHAWLGEIDLRKPDALRSLEKARDLEAGLACARLWLAAGKLLARDPAGALVEAERYLKAVPASAMGRILQGLCLERLRQRGDAARAYHLAAAALPVCSAAHLLESRAEPAARSARLACERALAVDSNYGLLAIETYKKGRAWGPFLEGIRRLAFDKPEYVGWYFRRDDVRYPSFQLDEYAKTESLMRLRGGPSWLAPFLCRFAARSLPEPGRWEASIAALERAIKRAPWSGWMYAWRALTRITRGRWEPQKALEDFNLCLRLQPLYHRAYAWRGAHLRKLGRYEEALADQDRAIALDDEYSFAYHERSLARRALGDPVGAVLDLDRAFRLEPRYSWVSTYGRSPAPEELRRGVRDLSSAIRRFPTVPSLWVWRGQLRLEARELSLAQADLARAAQLDPQNGLALAWYGRSLLETSRPDRAEALLRRACALEPQVPVFRAWLAECICRAGRAREAMKALDDLLREHKDKAWWARYQKASIWLSLGRPRRALREVGLVTASQGLDVEGYYLEAQAKLALADSAGALEAVDKAIRASPNFGRAFVLRAEIRRRLGRSEAALDDYAAARAKFPYLFNAEQLRAIDELLRGRAA